MPVHTAIPVDQVMQLALGYTASCVLAAAIDINLFTTLATHGPLPEREIRAELGLQARPADQFLTATCALGLTERDDHGNYRNSPLASTYLVPGAEVYLGEYIQFLHHRQYSPWGKLTEVLRTDTPVTWEPDDTRVSVYDAPDDPLVWQFFLGAHPLSLAAGHTLGTVIDFTARRSILDVGGGTGAYTIALTQDYPHLTGEIVEYGWVRDLAAEWIGTAGLSDRIAVTGGNFLTDPLPTGHDVVLLGNILHGWTPEQNQRLLDKAHTALDPAGQVIVVETMFDADKTGPPTAALIGLTMMIETPGGRSYSITEHATTLQRAGFTDVRVVPLDTPVVNYAIHGTKP